MKRNLFFILILGLILSLQGCDCGCNVDDNIELKPIETVKYELYISEHTFRSVYVFKYDCGDEYIKMYKSDNGPMNIIFEPKEQLHDTEDTESVLHQGTYFDY